MNRGKDAKNWDKDWNGDSEKDWNENWEKDWNDYWDNWDEYWNGDSDKDWEDWGKDWEYSWGKDWNEDKDNWNKGGDYWEDDWEYWDKVGKEDWDIKIYDCEGNLCNDPDKTAKYLEKQNNSAGCRNLSVSLLIIAALINFMNE